MSLGLRLGLSLGNSGGSGGAAASVGAARAVMPIAPTIHYHPNTAAITYLTSGAPTTFNATYANTSDTYITLTSAPTGAGIVIGSHLFIPGTTSPGTTIDNLDIRIVALRSGTANTIGATYTIATQPNVALTNVAMSAHGNDIATLVGDARGYADATCAPSSWAGVSGPPVVRTDLNGVKYLSIYGHASGGIGGYLQVLSALGIDSHNFSVLIVGRVHGTKSSGGAALSLGIAGGTGNAAPVLSTNPQLTTSKSRVGAGAPYVQSFRSYVGLGGGLSPTTPAPNSAKLQVGCTPCVFGVSTCTADGLNQATSPTNTASFLHIVNDQEFLVSANPQRYTNKAGFEIGRTSALPTNTAGYTVIDIYELVVWSNDELAQGATGAARAAAVAANFRAARNALMATRADVVKPYTDRIVWYGDSRSEVAFQSPGRNPAMLLTDPGQSSGVGGNVLVINEGAGGAGLQRYYGDMFDPGGMVSTRALFGSGHDRVIVHNGVNDTTTGSWPAVNTAPESTARGEEIYNGTGDVTRLDCTFMGYTVGNVLNVTSIITPGGGVIPYAINGGTASTLFPMPLGVGAAAPTGIAITGFQSGTKGGVAAYTLNQTLGSAIGSIGTPVQFTTYYATVVRTANELLSRGVKLSWAAEVFQYTGTLNDAQTSLRARIVGGSFAADVPAVSIFDLASITIAGKKILGPDAAATASTVYLDSLHQQLAGRNAVVFGGDTPANGFAYQARLP